MKGVTIYSDGSSKGLVDGSGGYGTIVIYLDDNGEVERTMEYTEGFKVTTNNRMELMGVIVGIESLKEPCNITVHSDSKYVVDAFNQNWIENWKSNGWHTALNKPVKNIDLWQRLLSAMEPHKCKFNWVKGHNGHKYNERCDYLAQSSADGIEFIRKEDGTLEAKDSRKDDVKYDPKDNDAEFIIDTLQKVADGAMKNKPMIINGAKFMVDEEGNIGPHPDENIEKCKKAYNEFMTFFNNINTSGEFKSIDFNTFLKLNVAFEKFCAF